MEEEYEMQEFADIAVDELRSFIDTEQQSIEQEHALIDKLHTWTYVIEHLDERIPANREDLHELSGRISEKLVEIRDLVESDMLKDLSIEKEEKLLLGKLREDVKHREWKAVKKDIKSDKRKQKKTLRLEKKELKQLHSLFIDLMKIMKRSKLIKSLDKSLTSEKTIDDYKAQEEYYFIQIYKFARAYERIFRQLWEKELLLVEKI